MARSTNARARRDVLKLLAAGKRTISHLQDVWNVRGTVYQPHPDGPSKMGEWVDRPDDLYPENQAVEWRRLTWHLDTLISDLANLRQIAADELAALEQRQDRRPQ